MKIACGPTMELSRASEEEVKSWFTDRHPEKEVFNAQYTEDEYGSEKSSACKQAPSHKFITATSCIDQVIRKKMQRKRRFDKLAIQERAEVADEPAEESKIEAIKKPAVVPSAQTVGHMGPQTMSKAARRRLKKKLKNGTKDS